MKVYALVAYNRDARDTQSIMKVYSTIEGAIDYCRFLLSGSSTSYTEQVEDFPYLKYSFSYNSSANPDAVYQFLIFEYDLQGV